MLIQRKQKARMDQIQQQIKTVTVIGLIANIVLSFLKIIGGFLANSHALIADGVHSISDLASDFLVLWASKKSAVQADDDHPYGHERIQTVATIVFGLLLILVAIGIAYDAIMRLFMPAKLLELTSLGIIIAALSVIIKELLFRYTINAAKRINSPILKANAWHHRSDALSSIVVMIGIIGVLLGFKYLDPLASIVVTLMIGHVAYELIKNCVLELIDTGIEKNLIKKLKIKIQAIDGVLGLHQLRTRHMGQQILADVHIIVANYISVSEGHRISDEVVRELKNILKNQENVVKDIIVHIDSEDDTMGNSTKHLPLRSVISQQIRQVLQNINSNFSLQDKNIILHYLEGKINIDLILPLKDCKHQEQLIIDQIMEIENINQVKILFVNY